MEAALVIEAESRRQKAKSRVLGERRKVKGERYLDGLFITLFGTGIQM
jgi:hypothetical protein